MHCRIDDAVGAVGAASGRKPAQLTSTTWSPRFGRRRRRPAVTVRGAAPTRDRSASSRARTARTASTRHRRKARIRAPRRVVTLRSSSATSLLAPATAAPAVRSRTCRWLFGCRSPAAISRRPRPSRMTSGAPVPARLPRTEMVGGAWPCRAWDSRCPKRRVRPSHARSSADKVYRGVRARERRPDARAHGADRAVPRHPVVGRAARAGLRLLHEVGVAARDRAVRRVVGAARHVPHRGHRARDRGAGRDLLGAVRHRVRAGPAAAPAHVVHRRARRDPEPHLRALGPRVPPAARDPPQPVAGHAPRVHPVLQDRRAAQPRELPGVDVHRRASSSR